MIYYAIQDTILPSVDLLKPPGTLLALISQQ